jgi:uncharacterized SAM-binding protein YcdF (DUF218 family)
MDVWFVLSKLLWTFVQPGNMFFLATVMAAALAWTRWRRAGRLILALLLTAALAVTILPIGTWLVTPLEDRFPAPVQPARVDGIIVLGGALNPSISRARGQPAVNDNAERLLAFVEMARRYPKARLVFTGGSGKIFSQKFKEADVARQVFRQVGLDLDRVVFERASRNTYDNAVLSRDLVRPEPDEVWLLITSARHMPRAWGVFEKIKWPTIPYPVDYTTKGGYRFALRFSFGGGLNSVHSGAREWIGLIYYYLSGRIDNPFPGPSLQ